MFHVKITLHFLGALTVLSKKLEKLIVRVITDGTVSDSNIESEDDYFGFSRRLSSFLVSLMSNLENRQENNELSTVVCAFITLI